MLRLKIILINLQLRTGYTYEGKFDATSAWGFVHGDLTVSNILHDKDFLIYRSKRY